MSNKNNIKGNLRERFDIQNNYEQIMNKIERKNNMKMKHLFKYALVPICLLLVVGFFIVNDSGSNITTFKTGSGNKIVVNKIEDLGKNTLSDGDVRIDADAKVVEEFAEYPFINNIKVPSDLKLSLRYLLYTKGHYDSKEMYINAPYDVLHDYTIVYESAPTSEGLIEKSINITFSKDFEPLRDYLVNHESLKTSTINGIELKIASDTELQISLATFSYKGLNFDIETKGITDIELAKVLESILK